LAAGVIVNVCLVPEATLTFPDGEIDPFEPAEAVIVYVVANAAVKVQLLVIGPVV
jgi:hypothetical protein